MAPALLILLVAVYLIVGLRANGYTNRTRLFLLGAATALPGLAYFFL